MTELSPIQWAVRPLKKYADFNGRAPRAEYWWFVLFQWLAIIGLMIVMVGVVAGSASSASPDDAPGAGFWVTFTLFGLAIVALLVPNLAVQVRRLHDQDLSGWFILLFFIPYLGSLISIVFMCIAGTRGPNRYGEDPYRPHEHLEDIFA